MAILSLGRFHYCFIDECEWCFGGDGILVVVVMVFWWWWWCFGGGGGVLVVMVFWWWWYFGGILVVLSARSARRWWYLVHDHPNDDTESSIYLPPWYLSFPCMEFREIWQSFSIRTLDNPTTGPWTVGDLAWLMGDPLHRRRVPGQG